MVFCLYLLAFGSNSDGDGPRLSAVVQAYEEGAVEFAGVEPVFGLQAPTLLRDRREVGLGIFARRAEDIFGSSPRAVALAKTYGALNGAGTALLTLAGACAIGVSLSTFFPDAVRGPLQTSFAIASVTSLLGAGPLFFLSPMWLSRAVAVHNAELMQRTLREDGVGISLIMRTDP